MGQRSGNPSAGTDSHGAIGLYRRMGFCSEGIRCHSTRVSGQFVDELMMAKLLPLQ
jgi:hypothetical protein